MFTKIKIWLRNTLVLPLIIGDVNELSRFEDDISVQDGSISSLVLGTTLVAITIVILLVTHTLRIVPPYKTEEAIRVTCACVSLLGILSLLLIVSHARRKNLSVRQAKFKIVKIIFLWIFAAGSLFRTLLYVIYTIEAKQKDYSTFIWFTSLLWNLFDFIFISIQTIFICVSSNYTFRKKLLLRYGVVFLLSSNVIIWFIAVLQESQGTFTELAGHDIYVSRNISDQTLVIADLISKSSVYTLPMLIEYTLMSVSCILALLPSVVSTSNNQELSSPVIFDKSQSIDEMDRLLPQNSPRWFKDITILYSAVYFICFLMVISEIIIAEKTTIDQTSQFFFQILQCINLLLLIFFNMKIVIFIAKRHYSSNSTRKKSHERNQVLILSCFGLQAYDVFGAFEGFFLSEVNNLSKLAITKHCVSIFATFYQTIVICKLKTYESRSFFYEINRMILAVSIINFGFWIGDCFIGKHEKNISYTEANIYGESYWNIVQNILFPVAIFYRFHSALEMFGIYSSIRKSPLITMESQNEYSRLIS